MRRSVPVLLLLPALAAADSPAPEAVPDVCTPARERIRQACAADQAAAGRFQSDCAIFSAQILALNQERLGTQNRCNEVAGAITRSGGSRPVAGQRHGQTNTREMLQQSGLQLHRCGGELDSVAARLEELASRAGESIRALGDQGAPCSQAVRREYQELMRQAEAAAAATRQKAEEYRRAAEEAGVTGDRAGDSEKRGKGENQQAGGGAGGGAPMQMPTPKKKKEKSPEELERERQAAWKQACTRRNQARQNARNLCFKGCRTDIIVEDLCKAENDCKQLREAELGKEENCELVPPAAPGIVPPG